MLSEKKKNRCAADSGSSSYSVFRTAKQILLMQRQLRHFLPRITASVLQMGTVTVPQSPKPLPVHSYHLAAQGKPPSPASSNSKSKAAPHNSRLTAQAPLRRLRHGICVAKMLDNVGLRYPHRASGAKAPRTLRPLPLLRFAVSATGGALTFAASSIICAFGLAAAAPRSPYRHLELCGIALKNKKRRTFNVLQK